MKLECGGWRKEEGKKNLCGVRLKLLVYNDKFESRIVMHKDIPQTCFKTFINNVLRIKIGYFFNALSLKFVSMQTFIRLSSSCWDKDLFCDIFSTSGCELVFKMFVSARNRVLKVRI